MLSLAAQHGLTVFLDPAETGSFLSVLDANGVTKARAYGRYLGARYRDVDNIVWMSGNDFQTWQNPGDDAVVQAVARGIQDVDDRHIHTVELNYQVSGSLDDPTWAPIIQLNASYTYFPTYGQVLTDYERPNSLPTFLVESNYDFTEAAGTTNPPVSNPEILRRQAYWALTSGAAGQMYGNAFTWPFLSGWQQHLDTPGSRDMGLVRRLFESRRWYDLAPDDPPTLVTAGGGTYAPTCDCMGDNDYVTAARAPDGSLAILYLPAGNTISVDLSRMGPHVRASWYDPTRGAFVPAHGALSNTTTVFQPPGNNHDGDPDWLLVLDAQPQP
ncbi:MAG TPA: DUF4038 domain-containing protein, partial [Myxococcota bacterium]|nr:DUF4038 domain-containing protein [Myxococcota bacterium]